MVTALFLLVGISIYNSKQYLVRDLAPIAKEFDVFASFFLSNDNSISYIPGPNIRSWYWYVTGMRSIAPYIGKTNDIPVAIVDPIFLDEDQSQIFGYADDCECLEAISDSELDELRQGISNLRDEPLSIELEYRNNFLSWQFGPYETGEYRLISPLLGSIPLPLEGFLPINPESRESLRAPFRLKYSSPEGWVTYSPELLLARDSEYSTEQLSWRSDY